MISIVTPVFNEEEILPLLWKRIRDASKTWNEEFEVVLVDDGSRDRSFEILADLAEADSRVRVVKLSRNFGHQPALSAGLRHARGDAVVFIDADLQDPPEFIVQLVEKWRAGYDVVYAVRRRRKGAWWKRASYSTFYRLLARIGDVEIPVDTGDFCLMDRRVVDVMLDQMPEQQRFLRGLRAYAGFRQIGMPYDRPERAAGEPKYGLGQLIQLALSGVIGFSFVPLRLATWLGLVIAIPSFLVGTFFIIHRVFEFPVLGRYATETPGLTTLAVGMFFLGGVTLLMLGILGEYVGRIYLEVKRRPGFIVDRVLGSQDQD